MGDLIDRAAALEALGEKPFNWNDTPEEQAAIREYNSAYNAIACLPTIPAVPMRRTKPVMGVSRDWLQNWWQCGNCESVIEQGDRYCRGCGAEVEWDDHN
jgi:hypothetical protein